jgi:hemin uptake protein HemP
MMRIMPTSTSHPNPSSPATPSVHTPAQPNTPRLNSQDLLGRHRELEIDHGGQIYRLRLTSLGKLILTK